MCGFHMSFYPSTAGQLVFPCLPRPQGQLHGHAPCPVRRAPRICLMFCCGCLEILKSLWKKEPHILIWTGFCQSCSWSWMTLILLKKFAQLFFKMSLSLGSSNCSLIIKFRYCIFGKNTTKVTLCPPSCIVSGSSQCWLIPILVILILVT